MKQCLLIVLISVAIFVWTGCSHREHKAVSTRTVSSVQDVTSPWSYDAGPAPETPMGKELIDIVAAQPYMPGISKELTGDQKFRPAFGPTLWRMLQHPNSIKILFIGQDGTHIAEAAGRTATAGFGGRAQDMAAHFGVETSAAFMNAFAFTIKGQYSGYGAPVITEVNGVKKVSFDSVVDNGIWMMSQDQDSPMVKWRNSLIDWIIRNNKDSLRLIVLFGGSAHDAIGTYIESRGGKVGAKFTNEDIITKKVKVPVFKSQAAGGNKELPIALTKDEKDIFKILGVNVPYDDLGLKPGDPKLAAAEAKLKEAQKALADNIEKVYPTLAISNAGIGKSGIIHPAQIGGYDLAKISINNNKTISLKGLKLSDGSTLNNDILVAEFPHPTSLSASPATAPAKVEKSLALLKPWVKAGWEIEADKGMVSKFEKEQPYVYGRADIGPAFYDFGTPANRMVSVSSASRMPGQPHIVVIGTRDRPAFDKAKIAAATNAKPADGISKEELFSARPRTIENRYVFDMGPGEKMAKIMKENLDVPLIGKMKNGKDSNPNCKDPEGAGNFNIKTHPLCVGDFGHYRGTFDKPKIVILADPDGVDDILTSRALTGTRGQYLHGLMQDIGINDKYLVLKTVPFGMDGATDEEWATVLGQTEDYRKKVLEAVMADGKVEMILADGKNAAQALTKLKIAHIEIKRTGTDNNSGIKEAAVEINKIKKFNTFTAKGTMANIPRSHLGFFSRVWEGTSGTRVLDSNSADDAGTAFAIIVPAWVYNQKTVIQYKEEREGVNSLKENLEQMGLPREDEKFLDFLKRRGDQGSFKIQLDFSFTA